MNKLCLSLFLIGFSTTLFAKTKVILDTDMGSDCDDAGAMAVLHQLANRGEVELLGVIFSSAKNKFGSGVCDAINTYYGKDNLPLGQNSHNDVGDPRDFYSKQIATNTALYHHDVVDTSMDMVSAYKLMLKKESDHSVTIITIGHPIGLVHLMRDDEGARLVKRKVSRWVAMGGGGWNLSKNGMAQYMTELLQNWPCKLYLSSHGATVITGHIKLPHTATNNPVRKAYEAFIGNCLITGRPSWDPIAVLFAIRPHLFKIDSMGSVEQMKDETVHWNSQINNPNHSRVLPAISDTALRDIIEGLMSEPPDSVAPVGLWKRFEVMYHNTSFSGNPFDLIVKGSFLSPSGRTLLQHGFYAGENNWKIYFMPDEEGLWTYKTQSSDPELNKQEGRFFCVASELKGPLTSENNRWVLKGEGGEFPVIWNPPVQDGSHWGFRGCKGSDPQIQKALQFADETIGARLLGFGELLIVPIDWAKKWPQSAVPYVQGKEGEHFYLPFWDQLNAKLDRARDLDMGAYIMFYSDDALKPDHFGLTPRSQKELRFFRYAVARLACYPHILWDSGIDIGEYRDTHWIDWYAEWFNQNDPWRHPVSSRSGGGSGGSMPESGTYYSTGGANLPTRSHLLELLKLHVPIAQTDHWRPFIKRGHWTHKKIRIAHWLCGLSGAQALYPDYNQGSVKYDEVLLAGKYIGYATHFFSDHLRGDIGMLTPHDELIISGGNAILSAIEGSEYVLYDQDGGSVKVDLSRLSGALTARWYNPRTGEYSVQSVVKGGDTQMFTSPTVNRDDDWVLHIYK